MTTPPRKRFQWPRPGTCRVCGCTDARACPGGCSWADVDETVCSTCAGADSDLAYVLALVSRLSKKYGRAADVVTRATVLCKEALARYGKRLANQEHG